MSNKCLETEIELECAGPCQKTKPLSEFVEGLSLCKDCKIKLDDPSSDSLYCSNKHHKYEYNEKRLIDCTDDITELYGCMPKDQDFTEISQDVMMYLLSRMHDKRWPH